jgi:glycosyltransferase involved in cell wall biosynthesis
MSQHEAERVNGGLKVMHTLLQVIRPALPTLLTEENVDAKLFRELYGDEEFILFVGDLGNARKNVLRLIQVVERVNLPLVLIGALKNTPHAHQVRGTLEDSQHAKYMGIVARSMLLSAMKACRILALPSFMEGIGLAAVEAGTLGARVVVTKNGAPPEYFGEYAWYVDPSSVDSIADGLLAAWHAPETPPLQNHLQTILSLESWAPRLVHFYEDALNNAWQLGS